MASGLLLGVGVRAAMRFVALEACVPEGFSLGGSVEVVAASASLGTPVAAALFAVRRRVPVLPRWTGPGVGATLFAALALFPPPAARSALADTPDTPAATAAAFALCFVAWGLAIDWIARARCPRLP